MTRVLLIALFLLGARIAVADDAGHDLSVYLRGHVLLHLSPNQTAGGAGGALGLRDTIDGRWILQADASHLFMVGHVLAVRAGAGIQRKGLWTPAALVTGTLFAGGRLGFVNDAHPEGLALPPMSLGLTLAPARFRLERATVSLLEIGVGIGSDFPGRGTAVQVTLLEVGASL